MKGIVLAGGTGSRLYPLTKVTNKHLLPVGRKPMIFYPVEKLIQAGIKDILIVTGVEHMGDIVNLLGSGKDFSCHFTYRVQDEAGGIAQALALAEDFVGNQHCCVILGDNLLEDDITHYVQSFLVQNNGAKLLLKEVHDPQRYGVAEVAGKKITHITEKPQDPKSNYAVTGIYMYDSRVFELIRTLKPSARGEYEITDVNNAYIEANEMTFDMIEGFWTDAGTFESLASATTLVTS